MYHSGYTYLCTTLGISTYVHPGYIPPVHTLGIYHLCTPWVYTTCAHPGYTTVLNLSDRHNEARSIPSDRHNEARSILILWEEDGHNEARSIPFDQESCAQRGAFYPRCLGELEESCPEEDLHFLPER